MRPRPDTSETEERSAVPVNGDGTATRVVGHAEQGMGMGGGGGGGGGDGMGGGGGRAISWGDLRTFSSFEYPVFRLFYGAMLGQMAAMNMQIMVRSLLVFRLTGSATALGVMAMSTALPMLVFSLFGGVIADRAQKKLVLLMGQTMSLVAALAIGLSLTTGFLTADRSFSIGPITAEAWWILIGASLWQGTIMGLMMPSRQAMLAEIVGEEQLMNAVALNTLGMNLFRLISPAAAGFIIAGAGFAPTYYVMTVLYGIAVLFILPMPRLGTMTISGRGALSDVVDGFKYVRNRPVIMLVLGITLVTVLLSMPYMMLLPVFTEEILEVGSSGLGILLMVSGVGAMGGSIVLASLPNKGRGAMLLVGSLILALGLTGFAFSESWPLSLGLMVVIGVGQTMRMTLASTLLMYYVEDEYRGRVMSIYMMEFGLTSLSVFFAAIMADVIGIQWSIGGMAMVLIVCTILFLIFVPRIRRLD